MRRREICTSRLRSNTSYSRPRAISISFSRDSGWRGWRANTLRTENSPVVSVISSSFLVSVRVARFSTKSPKAKVSGVSDGAPGTSAGPLRRSTAWMRAISSRGLKGLGR
ncbi:hypothetical protein D3C80_1749340 [compost metagenome]